MRIWVNGVDFGTMSERAAVLFAQASERLYPDGKRFSPTIAIMPIVDSGDAVEHFAADYTRAQCYVSTNYRELPSWVHAQELQEMEEEDRGRRIERFKRMMESAA